MIIDIIVLGVLLISALISFIRGFIREVLTILGVVGGLAAAYFGGPILSPFIKDWLGVKEGTEPERLLGMVPYPIVADVLSYGLIFIVIVIVLSLVSHFLAETVRAIGLGAIDRTLGIVFGLARGLLLIAVLYLPFHLSLDAETKTKWFEGSQTHGWMEVLAGELAGYLPDSAVKQIEDSARKVRENQEAAEEENAVEKVNQIDLLKGAIAPSGEQEAPQGDTNGYSDDFRQKMDKMFQQETQPPQPSPQPNNTQQPQPVQEQPAAQ